MSTCWRYLGYKVYTPELARKEGFFSRSSHSLSEGQAIAQAVVEGKVPNTLRFITYDPHVAWVGYHQAIDAELDVEFCRGMNIEFNRRLTGGGAVLIGREVLVANFLLRATDPYLPRDTEDILSVFAEGVLSGLKEFGLDVELAGKNDFEVKGKKVGSITYFTDGRLLRVELGVFLDLNLPLLLKVLRLPAVKLADKAVKTLEERVTCLNKELEKKVDVQVLIEVIKEKYQEVFNVEFVEGSLSDEEYRRARELDGLYSSSNWIYLRAVPRWQFKESLLKTRGGLIRVYVKQVDNAIGDVLITGDFICNPTEAIFKLERELKGARVSEVSNIINAFFDRESVELKEVSKEDLVDVITKALAG
ncbi:MAG: hypothetical protein DRN06_02365 [Thermoprotei archaeon]|nr:MAG: hypothetical protein DRN06_02365 [Thermoprotei archaeon]